MEFALWLLINTIVGIPILILSMLITSRLAGGVEFGTLGAVIWKSAVLLIVTQLILMLVPHYAFGILFVAALWWLGYGFLFNMDGRDAKIAAFVTVGMLLIASFTWTMIARIYFPEK